MPPVDELLAKVMSDVRPWGKRSEGMPLSIAKSSVFLRKGNGVGGSPIVAGGAGGGLGTKSLGRTGP